MQNKVVLVTGGTGSFGKAFISEILKDNPKQVRVYSRDELKQHELKETLNDSRITYLIGDVRDYDRLCVAMEGVDICVHAAAMKRIEKCETDPQEAIKTNIQGSVNVANACLQKNVKSAVLISTDKAVYPVNLYGATKLVAEKVWIQSNTYRGTNHPTIFSVVRYGNVLGSRGSVVTAFKAGKVKVTDPRMTRFFITLQQAVDLVKLAVEISQGGEIFIPILKSIEIYNLAVLISGQSAIEITNQRGAEKLHEVLFTVEENQRRSLLESNVSIVHPEITTWPYIKPEDYEAFQTTTSETVERYTDDEIRAMLGLTTEVNA